MDNYRERERGRGIDKIRTNLKSMEIHYLDNYLFFCSDAKDVLELLDREPSITTHLVNVMTLTNCVHEPLEACQEPLIT